MPGGRLDTFVDTTYGTVDLDPRLCNPLEAKTEGTISRTRSPVPH